MSEDSFNVKTPILSFGFSQKEHILEITEDKIYLIRTWNWKKMGFTYKTLQIINGELVVKVAKK